MPEIFFKGETTAILLATKNKHKLEELEKIFASLIPNIPTIGLQSWEEKNGNILEASEDGNTFIENALIKAKYYAKQTKLLAVADDSGLSIDHLNGAPGILSARFGGSKLTDEEKYNLVLEKMVNSKNRKAFFTSAIALAKPNGDSLYWEAQLHGLITTEASGENGFGYDPIFYLPQLNKTLAQLSPMEKNQYSHRALAINELKNDLVKIKKFIQS